MPGGSALCNRAAKSGHKKKLTPASREEISLAAIQYYLAYEDELPARDYTSEDIEYIIEQCRLRLQNPERDYLSSDIIH